MHFRYFIILVYMSIASCNSESKESTEPSTPNVLEKLKFDQSKWKMKEGNKYPYRYQMMNDVLYNDTIRSLNKNEITELLGEPDYTREGHLYYRITQKQLFSWTIRSRTMVIKLSTDGSIEWIKIHE